MRWTTLGIYDGRGCFDFFPLRRHSRLLTRRISVEEVGWSGGAKQREAETPNSFLLLGEVPS